jgi:hypothetical protein
LKDKLECQKNDNLLYTSISNEILFKKQTIRRNYTCTIAKIQNKI